MDLLSMQGFKRYTLTYSIKLSKYLRAIKFSISSQFNYLKQSQVMYLLTFQYCRVATDSGISSAVLSELY